MIKYDVLITPDVTELQLHPQKTLFLKKYSVSHWQLNDHTFIERYPECTWQKEPAFKSRPLQFEIGT